MKTLFLLPIVSLLFIFSSCKKDSANNVTGTITATVNGTSLSFNVEATAVLDTVRGNYGVAIIGLQSFSLSSKEITLAISGGSTPIAVGTYTDTSTVGRTVLIGYANAADSTAWSSTGTAPNISTVTITSLNSSQIQGTFNGQLELALGSNPGASTATVTNGSFNLHVTLAP
ncbi:MAG: hypothetical protein WDM71_04305 [Ferruginibacter sp.]